MDLIEIGYISKAHGLKGDVILKIPQEIELIEDVTVLFLLVTGNNAPYFIEQLRYNNGNHLLKLEGISNIDVAKKLIGKKVFANTSDVIIHEDDGLNTLIGYTIKNDKDEIIGPVTGFIDHPINPVIIITINTKEALLPYNDDLIIQIDSEAKTIVYNFPEGLLDLYL